MSDQELTTIEQSIENIFNCEEPYQYFFDNEETIWFHGSIICQRLEFSRPDRTITNYTDDDERRIVKILGRDTWFVSEPGLWGLILRSKSNDALRFKRELKHEILPRLRKNRVVMLSGVQVPQIMDELARVDNSPEIMVEFLVAYQKYLFDMVEYATENAAQICDDYAKYVDDPKYKKLLEKGQAKEFDALRRREVMIWVRDHIKELGIQVAYSQIDKEKYKCNLHTLIRKRREQNQGNIHQDARIMSLEPGTIEKCQDFVKNTFEKTFNS